MIVTNFKQMISLATLHHRVQGLTKDGYQIVFKTATMNAVIYKLMHRNGTRIMLSYDVKQKTIIQKTNGREVHTEQVY